MPTSIKTTRCLLSAILLFFVAALGYFLFPAHAYASDSDQSVTRIIDVVYDDSGSMDEGAEWSQAHYALETLVGMMGPEDQLNVFTMSNGDNPEPSIAISMKSGDTQSCVDSIHRVFSEHSGNTTFAPAQQAYAHLNSLPSNENTKKYLVVLTDGEFIYVDDMTTKKDGSEAVSAKVNEYLATWAAESDVEVHYVLMGEESADIPLPSEGYGLSVSATADRGILYGIVDVCNEIYGMASLPETSFVNDTITIPIPTKRIVVFAQGQDVSVDYAEIEGDRLSPSTVRLKYADKPHTEKNEMWEKAGCPNDQSLQGIVATFEPNGTEGFNAGSMMLCMENAEYVEIYYEPYVNVEVTLNDAGVSDSGLPWPINKMLSVGDTVIDSTNTDVRLTKGSYYVSSRMLNPITGEEINPEDSENLIHDMSIEATLEYTDGETVEFNGENKVVLKEGEGTLKTTAVVQANENDPNPTVINQKMDVVVDPVSIATLMKRFGLLFALIALIIAIIIIIRKHMKAPRLPKGLAPLLKDKTDPRASRTLRVEPSQKNTPFFGEETQEFYLRIPRNYTSRVMPSTVKLRATKAGMIIDNWSQMVDAAHRNDAPGAIKVGSKDLKKVKQGEPSPIVSASTRISFVARRGSTETKLELRLK
ncbi:MAG: vWA domain-containing protein [Eggerthellaceae bacterium]|nr:vWA domain-containing protein [Eggerthellaceae bacterium]